MTTPGENWLTVDTLEYRLVGRAGKRSGWAAYAVASTVVRAAKRCSAQALSPGARHPGSLQRWSLLNRRCWRQRISLVRTVGRCRRTAWPELQRPALTYIMTMASPASHGAWRSTIVPNPIAHVDQGATRGSQAKSPAPFETGWPRWHFLALGGHLAQNRGSVPAHFVSSFTKGVSGVVRKAVRLWS